MCRHAYRYGCRHAYGHGYTHVYNCACRHAYRRMCGCVCRVLPLPTRLRSAALPNNCSVLLQLNFHTIGRHWFPRTKGAKDKVNTAAPPSASPAAGSATASAPAAARTATGRLLQRHPSFSCSHLRSSHSSSTQPCHSPHHQCLSHQYQ